MEKQSNNTQMRRLEILAKSELILEYSFFTVLHKHHTIFSFPCPLYHYRSILPDYQRARRNVRNRCIYPPEMSHLFIGRCELAGFHQYPHLPHNFHL